MRGVGGGCERGGRMALVSFMRAWGGAGDWVACWHSGGHAGAWGLAKDVAQLLQALLHLRNAGQLLLQPLPLLCEAQAHRRVQLLKLPAALAVELQQVRVVFPVGTRWDRHCGHPIPQGRPRHQGHLPQRGPVGDGQQRNARVLGCLEDLALHIDAHSAGTFIQQGILGPWGVTEDSCRAVLCPLPPLPASQGHPRPHL